ncbi:hypothetical protein LTR94_033565, partial [Friedmanniomyces endolithicus]
MLMLALGLVRQTNADLAGVTLSNEAPAIGERLKRLIVPARRVDIVRQIERTGAPALRSVYEGLQQQGWGESRLEITEDSAALLLDAEEGRTFIYRLEPRARPLAAYTALEASEARRSKAWFLAAQTHHDIRSRDLTGFT